MRVQLTLSTPTTRWNCMFTYSKDLTWNVLKFSKIYLLIADHSFQIFLKDIGYITTIFLYYGYFSILRLYFSQRYWLYYYEYYLKTVTLSALFVFVSVFYTFVWLLKLCTILGFLVSFYRHIIKNQTFSSSCMHTMYNWKYFLKYIEDITIICLGTLALIGWEECFCSCIWKHDNFPSWRLCCLIKAG